MSRTAFAYRLKLARRSAGLSRRALARAVGCSVRKIACYERGQALPDSLTALRLAKSLGVHPSFLLNPVVLRVDFDVAPCRKRRKDDLSSPARSSTG